MVRTCNEILFSLKKERNSDTCYHLDAPQGHYARYNKPVTEGKMQCDSAYMRHLELQNERNSGDWLHNDVNVLNTNELYTKKWFR